MPRTGRRAPAPSSEKRNAGPEWSGFMRRACDALKGTDTEGKTLTAGAVLEETKDRCLAIVNSLIGARAVELAIPEAPTEQFQAFCAELAPHLAGATANKNGSHVIEAVLARIYQTPSSEESQEAVLIHSSFQRLVDSGLRNILASPHASFVLRRALAIPSLSSILEVPLVDALRNWGEGEKGLAVASTNTTLAPLISTPKIRSSLTTEEILEVIENALKQSGNKECTALTNPPCALCASALLDELGERGEGEIISAAIIDKGLLPSGSSGIASLLAHSHTTFLLASVVRAVSKGAENPGVVDPIYREASQTPPRGAVLEVWAAFVELYGTALGGQRRARGKRRGKRGADARMKLEALVSKADIPALVLPVEADETRRGTRVFRTHARYDTAGLHFLTALCHCPAALGTPVVEALRALDGESLALLCNTLPGAELVVAALHAPGVSWEQVFGLATNIAGSAADLLSRGGCSVVCDGVLDLSPPGSDSATLKALCALEETAIEALALASHRARQGPWYAKVSAALDCDGHAARRKVWRESRRAHWKARALAQRQGQTESVVGDSGETAGQTE